jgi:hypothetical protein
LQRNRASTRRIGIDEHSGRTSGAANGLNDAYRKLEEFSIGEISFANLDEIQARGRPFGAEGDESFGALGLGIGEENAAGDGAEEHSGVMFALTNGNCHNQYHEDLH